MLLEHISHSRMFTFAPTLIPHRRPEKKTFINKKIDIKGN